jgi:hypothetical protein
VLCCGSRVPVQEPGSASGHERALDVQQRSAHAQLRLPPRLSYALRPAQPGVCPARLRSSLVPLPLLAHGLRVLAFLCGSPRDASPIRHQHSAVSAHSRPRHPLSADHVCLHLPPPPPPPPPPLPLALLGLACPICRVGCGSAVVPAVFCLRVDIAAPPPARSRCN